MRDCVCGPCVCVRVRCCQAWCACVRVVGGCCVCAHRRTLQTAAPGRASQPTYQVPPAPRPASFLAMLAITGLIVQEELFGKSVMEMIAGN